jgi:hypothetical protein
MGSDDGVQHSELLSFWTETDPVSETLCSLIFLEYWTMDKVQKLSNSED